MSGRWWASLALCMAMALIACRPAETPPPASARVPGNTVSGQAEPRSQIASTPEKPQEFIPSPNNLRRVRYMVFSVTLFTLAHELGHMVVDEYKIPMIANKENSADRFA